MIVQHSKGFVSQNVDLLSAAAVSDSELGGINFPSDVGHALMRVKVDNISTGWFAGVVWKPTGARHFGFELPRQDQNKMTGKYNLYADQFSYNLMTQPSPFGATVRWSTPPTLAWNWPQRCACKGSTGYSCHGGPGLGASVQRSPDPGTSVTWTEWSSFRT